MAKIDINLKATSVFTETSSTQKELYVEIENVDETEILNCFSIQDVIDHFGEDEILDKIGADRVKEYFNLKDSEEE